MKTLVIRFSSLGDIVLSGAVTANLGPVEFLTLSRYVDLAARLPGVTRVHAWEETGRAITKDFDRIVDLHASPRSRWATAFRRAKVSRVKRYDLRRRARTSFKIEPPPPVIDRYAEAAGVTPATRPWMRTEGGPALLMVPFTAHRTKAWPAERYVMLGQRWKGPILALGSLSEREGLEAICSSIGPRARVISENGFDATLSAIQSGRIAVGGDTGLIHLAAASGVPTVGLFGPTSSRDGFWSYDGLALEADLPCRPCSRHGGTHCPIGDHHCMDSIDVDKVWNAIEALA